MARKKKQPVYDITINSYAAEGKSVAQLEDGKVLFVENAIPGDVVNVRITKAKKNWAEGKVLQLVTPSPHRIAPFCQHFGVCGGCKWQMLPYELQLKYKQQQVHDQLQRIGQVEFPPLQTIVGSPKERYYRNKLEFTFSSQRYRTGEELKAAEGIDLLPEPALGFHAPGLFDKVVPIETCYLQQDPTNLLLKTLRDYTEAHNLPYYDFKNHQGWLRNVVLRIARTGEILVNLVIHHEDKKNRIALLEEIKTRTPGITS